MTTKCNKCGDESNSDPGLTCGRSLGVDEDGDETLPPYCDGTYLRIEADNANEPLRLTLCSICDEPTHASESDDYERCAACRADAAEVLAMRFGERGVTPRNERRVNEYLRERRTSDRPLCPFCGAIIAFPPRCLECAMGEALIYGPEREAGMLRMFTTRELAEAQGLGEVRRLEDLDPRTQARIRRGIRKFTTTGRLPSTEGDDNR